VASAASAIAEIMAQPAIPCALEFIDGNAIEMVRRYSRVALPTDAGALLMIEVDGFDAAMAPQIESIRAAAENPGLLSFSIASSQEEVEKLWETRKALSPALRKIAPKKINEDVVVPVTQLPKLIAGIDALSTRYELPIVNFGHAGNGNIHVNLLYNPDDPDQHHRAHACLDALFTLVLDLKGTLSGEHGVGIEKRDYVDREIDPVSLSLMAKIKAQFDPKGILNWNKGFPMP
jgi:D-lactate dehydrogenase